jgi:hypothetical protein
MRNVLYYFLDHKKINGTLFYCFEYFLICKRYEKDILFHICNISEKDLIMVKEVLKERYVFELRFLDDVRPLNSIQEIYNAVSVKTLILDLHSFNRTNMFIKNEILCFSNENHTKVRSDFKKISYYGFYDYQAYDFRQMLKLNFSAMRLDPGPEDDAVLVSSRLYNYHEIELPEEIKHKKVITKTQNEHTARLFNSFDTLFYFHSDFDTNNRLIPECFYYGKKIIVKINDKFNDSIKLRLDDINENGLKNYILDENDLLVKDFLA